MMRNAGMKPRSSGILQAAPEDYFDPDNLMIARQQDRMTSRQQDLMTMISFAKFSKLKYGNQYSNFPFSVRIVSLFLSEVSQRPMIFASRLNCPAVEIIASAFFS